jgi:hypothetical protein
MPIHLDISHIDRLVVAVVIGEVTPDDILAVVREFTETGAQHYRKIIDTTAGSAPVNEERLAAFAAFARSDSRAAFRGPLAFVVDPARGEHAEKFAELTAEERPVKVFHSLHQARKWLNEVAKVQPRR